MKNLFLHLMIIIIMLLNTQIVGFAQEKIRIVVIPKSTDALFWKSVRLGAKLGATALSGVEIIWNGPQNEDDKEKQISIVEASIVDNVSGIMLSPIHQDALAIPVAKAMKNKIPVLIFDSPLKGIPGKEFISFVGIDNRKAGKLAGEHLAKLLKGTGAVVLLRHVKDQANTTQREEGFLEAMSNYRNIQVLEKDSYSGGSVDEAKKVSKGLLNKLINADGVFCPNEQSTIGMLLTLQEAKIASKIKFVGFDTPIPVVEALKKGEISAIVAQDPARIGYESVKNLVDHVRGKKISNKIDIDVQIITKENMNNPEIQKLLALPRMLTD